MDQEQFHFLLEMWVLLYLNYAPLKISCQMELCNEY